MPGTGLNAFGYFLFTLTTLKQELPILLFTNEEMEALRNEAPSQVHTGGRYQGRHWATDFGSPISVVFSPHHYDTSSEVFKWQISMKKS